MVNLPEHERALLGNIIQLGVLAADMWDMDNQPWPGTKAEWTRKMIETALSHVVEQGLLDIAIDAQAQLERGIPLTREEH